MNGKIFAVSWISVLSLMSGSAFSCEDAFSGDPAQRQAELEAEAKKLRTKDFILALREAVLSDLITSADLYRLESALRQGKLTNPLRESSLYLFGGYGRLQRDKLQGFIKGGPYDHATLIQWIERARLGINVDGGVLDRKVAATGPYLNLLAKVVHFNFVTVRDIERMLEKLHTKDEIDNPITREMAKKVPETAVFREQFARWETFLYVSKLELYQHLRYYEQKLKDEGSEDVDDNDVD